MVRLNQFISRSGICSRRTADELIKQGKVKVNGEVIPRPFHRVEESDRVELNGKRILPEKFVYVVFNKPKGVTVTLNDRFAEKKITDFIPERMGRLYPVGRLDKDSRGLIILTNDGDFCYQLTHPKFEIEKEYLIRIKGACFPHQLKRLRAGVVSEGDLLKARQIFVEKPGERETLLRAIVCEGKNRHLRRMFKQTGLSVIDLKRIRVGDLKLGRLNSGEFRVLNKGVIYGLTLGTKIQT